MRIALFLVTQILDKLLQWDRLCIAHSITLSREPRGVDKNICIRVDAGNGHSNMFVEFVHLFRCNRGFQELLIDKVGS